MSKESSIQSLELSTPWMNAAGSLGFTPDPNNPGILEGLGTFVTNPISARPRRAGKLPRVVEIPGGALLHTGHPNPGVTNALKRHAASWAKAPLPIIVHIFADKPEELRKMLLRVEELENILAIEVGFSADASAELVSSLAHAAQGELPSIIQLPLLRALELAETVLAAGAAAISLGAPRGTLPGPNGKPVSGRLYGSVVFPLALEATYQLAKLKSPLIACGGIRSRVEGEALLAAGAMGVQLDLALWKSRLG